MNPQAGLPPALVHKLTDRGYEVTDLNCPLDLGAEKYIYPAERKQQQDGPEPVSTGAVVLYSKKADKGYWAWHYKRELEVFQDLKESGQEHKHIIRMLDFLEPCEVESEGGPHGPCMVLERVDPLGFDMFKVVKMYQGAKARTLPIAQWMHYLGQLIEGVGHLHERGWVHGDLKPDNVMVGQGHEIKIIDFGFARRNGIEFCPGRTALYAPPEFGNTKFKVDKSGDLWLLGAMMFVVFAQMQVCFRTPDGKIFEVTNHPHARRHGVTAAIKEWWGKSIDPVVCEAIDNLLRRDPLERWTLARLQKWWESSKGDLDREKLLPLPSSPQQSLSCRFSKAPPPDRLVKTFGLEVTADSELIGKFIGTHTAEDGTLVEGKDKVVDFRRFAGATVLFIDRGENIVKFPLAKDQLRLGDFVYYLLLEESAIDTEEQREFHNKAQEARMVGVEIWLEFDWFEFPRHCVGATVGEIGVAKNFGINVHFIARSSEASEAGEALAEARSLDFIDVGRHTVILGGDHALVCRLPDRTHGRSYSILSDELLRPFFEEPSFRSRLGLEDNGSWQEWQARCLGRL